MGSPTVSKVRKSLIVSLPLSLLAPNVSRKRPLFAGRGAAVCRPLQVGERTYLTSGDNCQKSDTTAQSLAQEYGVGEATIKRDASSEKQNLERTDLTSDQNDQKSDAVNAGAGC
jgi:hypothetical protein